MRHSLTASVALFALAAVAGTALGAESVPAREQSARTSGRSALAYYGSEISRFRKETWHWQRLMGAPLTPTGGRVLAGLTPSTVREAAEQWRQRSAQAHRRAQHPPHLREFLCIHRYEAGWTDTGAPYYGGLQMDLGFQQSYGGWLYARKGTADNWSPLEQIWTAEKALASRGFWPWPNTARYCGLI